MIGVLQRGSVLRIDDAAIRRTLGRAQRAIMRLARMARSSLAFVMAASLVISALAPPSAVEAQTSSDPVARLQFIVHKVHIRDDEDLFGSGELQLAAGLCADDGTHPYNRSFQCAPGPSVMMSYSFSASSGDDVILNRVAPRVGDSTSRGASAEAGLPVYAG
jgi:hypothetical protein